MRGIPAKFRALSLDRHALLTIRNLTRRASWFIQGLLMSVITVKRTVIRQRPNKRPATRRSFRELSRSYFAREKSLEFVDRSPAFCHNDGDLGLADRRRDRCPEPIAPAHAELECRAISQRRGGLIQLASWRTVLSKRKISSAMKRLISALLLSPLISVMAEDIATAKFETANPSRGGFDIHTAERFAHLALACVKKEYPNKISHVLNSDADVAPPRKLTPAFYGCYDWHSSVHGHWLLVRLARTFPEASFAAQARDALRKSLTAENLKREAAYVGGEGRASFERPYGLAWLLQLCAELREWDDEQARQMSANLRPLEDAAVERLKAWLPKLSHPVRIGEHNQTAFGLGLMLDYARSKDDEAFAKLVTDSAKKFFLADKNCPLSYEPSGEDFLSPCLGEADVNAACPFIGRICQLVESVPAADSSAASTK